MKSPSYSRLVLLLTMCTAASVQAQRPPLFQSEILPVLGKNCNSCHNASLKMSGLDLSSFAGLMAGGASGPVISPGKPDRSLLWKMIDSNQMPKAGKLTAADKQLIRTYIEQGRFPALSGARRARDEAKITPAARNWWSFRKPVTPPVPQMAGATNEVDAFLLQKLRTRGWGFQPEAGRDVLIRRATLDLTGLLPTAAEVKAFVNDTKPDAYERLIDRLLQSPHYGEQWGRHWLDIAGYSDSIGDGGDAERDVAWRYRDYVIKSFNKNKPYDRFLLEQLAGDQLVNYDPRQRPRPDQLEPIIATGFLRMTADITDNQTIYEVDKYFDALQKATETSMKAVMGLSVGCARCHDHKFDPILQSDYYKLTASFQASYDPENWLAASLSFGEWPSRMVLNMEPRESENWKNATRGVRRELQVLATMYDRFRKATQSGVVLSQAERQAIIQQISGDPKLVIDSHISEGELADAALEKQYPELIEKKHSLAAMRERLRTVGPKPDYILGLWDVSKNPSPTYILQRGNYLAPGDPVEPGIPAVLDNPAQPFRFPDPAAHPEWHHTGRRLTLARWLTNPDHPLTARVFVNRVWQFHFGEGIVRSVDDFGTQGAAPSHPELLDWLATQFVAHHWDIDWLHRQIMLSAAYRQSSQEDAAKLAADPADRLLWRKSPLRLDAEVIRDSMLQVSGLLDPAMFGPQQPLTKFGDGQWTEDEKRGNPNRRSIYLSYARTRPQGFLRAFDCPDMTSDSVTQRFHSALPVQALAMINNPLVRRTAKALSASLWKQSGGSMQEAITLAFQAGYGRNPSPMELKLAADSVAAAPQPEAGFRIIVQAVLGANDFLYSF